MSILRGPNIVTNELVLTLDAASTRCYPGSGTTATDLAKGRTGTLNNNGFSSDNYGAFTFDGADDYILFADNDDYTFSDAVGTWESWCRPTGNAGVLEHTIMTKANYSLNTREYQFQFRYSSGTYYFYLGQQNNNSSWKPIGSTTTSNFTINQWYHVLVTSDGNGNAYMYVNGEEVDTATGWHTSQTNLGAPLCVGATINGTDPIQEFVGDIAVCKLYKKFFSSAEALQNFNATKSRFGL